MIYVVTRYDQGNIFVLTIVIAIGNKCTKCRNREMKKVGLMLTPKHGVKCRRISTSGSTGARQQPLLNASFIKQLLLPSVLGH